MIETAFTKALGLKIPVMQGGMQWVGLASLAAAVSNAGGLGTLTALTQPDPEALRAEIRKTKALTNRIFAVNLTILPSINPPPYEEYARVAIQEGVKVLETAGNQPADIIKLAKKHDVFVIHKCTSIRHALSAVRLGVDMVSMDGLECAGHPGEDNIGGLVLLARAAQELTLPFLASGGIADGRGLAAALSLGAAGVNMGTRFLCTIEAPIHIKIKERIVDASELDTVHILSTLHNTARVFKNKVAKEVVAIERRPGGAEFKDVQPLVAGARGRKVYENGDEDAGMFVYLAFTVVRTDDIFKNLYRWSAGISIGLIKNIPSCQELLTSMESEAEAIISRLSSTTSISPLPKSKL